MRSNDNIIYGNFIGCKVPFLSLLQEEATLAGDSYTIQQVLHCDVVYMCITGDHNDT